MRPATGTPARLALASEWMTKAPMAMNGNPTQRKRTSMGALYDSIRRCVLATGEGQEGQGDDLNGATHQIGRSITPEVGDSPQRGLRRHAPGGAHQVVE